MDKKEVTVLVRPESISWEEISTVLKRAHSENVRSGIILPYPQLPPEEIYAKTEGRGGVMFVALSEGIVVGTGAVAIIEKNLWCGRGKYAYCYFDAVLPDYSGQGVYRKIVAAQEGYAKSYGVSRMLFDTDERNKRILEISEKNGYRRVDYKIRENRYSVLMVKWLGKASYSRLGCALRFARIKFARKRMSK